MPWNKACSTAIVWSASHQVACTTMAKPHPDSPAFSTSMAAVSGSRYELYMSGHLRLYWPGTETRANLLGGPGDAPEAPVVERARGRRACGLVGVTAVAAAGEQFLPVLGFREGGQQFIFGSHDRWLHCLFDPPQRARWRHSWREIGLGRVRNCLGRRPRCGVLRAPESQGAHGGGGVSAVSTPLAYALTERATQDQIPLLTVGVGRSDAADGRVFPYVFNPPVS